MAYQLGQVVLPRGLVKVPVCIDRGCRCSVSARNAHEIEMSPGSLCDYNRDFITILNDVRLQSERSLTISKDLFLRTMTELRDAGRGAFRSMGEDFCNCWGETLPEQDERLFSLTFQTSAFPILWEFLYSGDPMVGVDPHSFWGYRHMITRILVGLNQVPQTLEDPENFLFCKNQYLAHWEEEQRSLLELTKTRNFHWVSLDELLPLIIKENLPLADAVIIAWASERFDIIHLASHLIAPTDAADNILAAHLKLSYLLTDIQIPLRRLNAVRGSVRFQKTPLIFINACKSMTNPALLSQGESFPHSFLNLGASSVIATACDIPDLFAKEFSQKFYEFLFENRGGSSPTVSEALCHTRQFFMDEYSNPLGLAYGLYGHSDLSICWE